MAVSGQFGGSANRAFVHAEPDAQGPGNTRGISGEGDDAIEYSATHPMKADDKFPRGPVTETLH